MKLKEMTSKALWVTWQNLQGQLIQFSSSEYKQKEQRGSFIIPLPKG